MISLLKMFGKGILYVIGFPFFVAVLLLFGVIGIFLFLFQLIKSIFYFFTGRKFFPELPEDKELRLLKEKAAAANGQSPISEAPVEQQVNPTPVITPMPAVEEPVVAPAPAAAPFQEENSHKKNIEKAIFVDMGEDCPIKPFGDYDYVEGAEDEEIEAELEEESILEDMTEEESPVEQEEILPEPEPAPQPASQPEPIPVEVVPMKEATIETAVESNMPSDEVLEEYVPDGSAYFDEDEEEDTNSGVSIDYDL